MIYLSRLNVHAESIKSLAPTVSCINDSLFVQHVFCIPVTKGQSNCTFGVQDLINCSSAMPCFYYLWQLTGSDLPSKNWQIMVVR